MISKLVYLLVPLILFYFVHILRLNRRYPYPGPLLAKITPLWLYIHVYRGTEASAIRSLHLKYNSPVIRIAPTQLSISNQANDPEHLNPVNQIYVHKGGLPKAPCYTNFDVDRHATIFSTLDPDYRSRRSKAVLPLFAPERVREGFNNQGDKLVQTFISRLNAWRSAAVATGQAQKLDITNECRRLSVDLVTGYLYGQTYGALDEDGLLTDTTKQTWKTQTMTASAFVDSYVSVGGLFLLPPSLVTIANNLLNFLNLLPDPATTTASLARVDSYCRHLASSAKPDHDTYQSRLLFKAGISASETQAQLKDLIFAGTDTPSTNLATLMFHLIRTPHWLSALKTELLATGERETPLLDATIKEGLRLGLGNPPRLPRLVPHNGQGIHILDRYIPPGTIIGCSSYALHLDPTIFSDPFAFQPQRWLDVSDKAALGRMNASMMPWGAGNRQCIARNLATQGLVRATGAIVRSGVLEGLTTVGEEIQRLEWFNARARGRGVEVWLPGEIWS